MCALNDLVRSGKVRYIGASSMYAWQFAKAQHVAAMNGYAQFVSMQNHYNLVYREEEREMIPLCRDQKVAIIPWSPLARGFLIGNRKSGDREQNATTETSRAKSDAFAHKLYYTKADFDIVDRVTEIAKKRNVNNAQVATAWILSKPGITAPIIGASKLSHLDDAIAATKLILTQEEIDLLERDYQPHNVSF
jgi:aryl-alcohol dehydrogenase (NADP+)